MIISQFLSALAAKLAGLGVAAKAGMGLGAAATAAAGAVAVLPDAANNAVKTNPAVSTPAPSVGSAVDAAKPDADGDGEGDGPSTPGSNANAAATGLDRARQTPAGAHIPSFVPGPPSGTPGGAADDQGRSVTDQTPAASRRPR
jgi:hypothetical protein